MLMRRLRFAAVALAGLLLPSLLAVLVAAILARGHLSFGKVPARASLDEPASTIRWCENVDEAS